MNAPDPELPRGIALAWGVAANPQRGPKREMTIEKIVEAAVELADEGGLAAVSMSSVATKLGFTPMSLYRYVTAKDDLVLLMQEEGIGVPTERVAEASGWREGLRVWAEAQAEVYGRHPWVLDIPVSGLLTTPNNLAWFDAGMATLRDTGLSYEDRASVCLAVEAQVRWRGQVERSYRTAAEHVGTTPDALEYSDLSILREFVTPEQFPEVAAAVAAGAFEPRPGDPFAFGLERVLDGIQFLLDGKSPVLEEVTVDPLTEQASRDPKVREGAKAVREAEKKLRETRKRERELLAAARERLAR